MLIDLDPAKGSETKKIRRGIIISNDIGNQTSRIVIIAPITSKVQKIFPFEVAIEIENTKAKIMFNDYVQSMPSNNTSRLQRFIMMVPPSIIEPIIEQIDEAIKLVFCLEEKKIHV